MMASCPGCGARCDQVATVCPVCATPLRSFAVERRHLTTLFADLCGSTAFAEGRDPEDVHAVISRCISAMSDIIAHYGGTVIRVIGDEVMAVFGAPAAYGDDAERATRAAMALASADLGGLPVRVGVNSGEVYVAPLGTGQAHAFTVTGAPVNLAARLRELAPEDGVLVGEQTRRGTRGRIEYEPLPGCSVKGVTGTFTAWAPRATAIRPGRPVSHTHFVGRAAEAAVLTSVWGEVTTRNAPRVVTVAGAAGVGKTRFVTEWAAGLSPAPTVVSGKCHPYGRPSPYDAVAEVLRGLACVRSLPDLAQVDGALDQWLVPRVGEHDRGNLRMLAGCPVELPAGADLQSLVGSLVRLLDSLARPTVLVLDDLHWCSPSQLALLNHTAARLRRSPVLMIALTRDDEGAGLPGRLMRLEPLAAEDTRHLAHALLGPGMPAGIADVLVFRAGGMPLFLEELAAEHHERGTLTGGLPGTLVDTVTARLDGLPEPTRTTAQVAAVLGRGIRTDVLAAACGRSVDDDVSVLRARGFLHPDDVEERLSFRHDVIREVAEGLLPRADRREVHARVAMSLERDGGSAEVLAHHWRLAGDREKAFAFLVAAADETRRAWAKADAASRYAEAAAVLAPDDPRRLRMTVERGLTLVELGDFRGAVEVLEPLLDQLEAAERAEVCIGLSTALFWLMQTRRAQELAQAAVRSAPAGTRLRVRASAVHALALSTLESRTPQGIAEAERALARWPADAPAREKVGLVASLGSYQYWVGAYGASVRHSTEAYRLGREIHDLDQTLLAASSLGLSFVGSGRHELALSTYDEAVRLGKDHELVPRFTARLVSMWGGALRELGDTAGARQRASEAIELALSAAFPFPVLQSQIDVLCCDLLDGRIGAADRDWARLHEQATAMRGWHNWLTLGRLAVLRAEIDLAMGRPDTAERAARAAEQYARHTHRRKYVVAAQRLIGIALLELRRQAEAVAVLDRAVLGAKALRHPQTLWLTEASCGHACSAAGRDLAADAHSEAARQALKAFASGLTTTHRRQLLGSPLALLDPKT